MKKLMILALLTVGVSAFAANNSREEASIAVSNLEGRSVETSTTMSLGDSFMAAFGMKEGNIEGASSSEGSTNDSGTGGNSTGASVPVGVVSSAINVATTITNNSTTIVTPYGKY